jgi:hypothetical protein
MVEEGGWIGFESFRWFGDKRFIRSINLIGWPSW